MRQWEWRYQVRRLHPEQAQFSLLNKSFGTEFVRYSSNGKQLVVHSLDGDRRNFVSFWILQPPKQQRQIEWTNNSRFTWVAINDRQTGIVYCDGQHLKLIDCESGEIQHSVLRPLVGPNSASQRSTELLNIALSADGSIAFTITHHPADKQWSIHQSDLAKGKQLPLQQFDCHVYQIASSPDGRWLAIGGYGATRRDGRVTLFNLDGMTTVDTSFTDMAQVTALTFSFDSTKLAIGGEHGAVSIWSIPEERELHHWRRHSARVESVAFDASASRLVSGGHDLLLKVADLVTGQELRSYKGHVRPILETAYSPDGMQLASVSESGRAKLWDLNKPSGQAIYAEHEHAIASVDVAPDSQLVASGDRQGAIRIWDARPMGR